MDEFNPGRRHGHKIEVEKWGFKPINNKRNRTATTLNIMTGTTKVFKSRIDQHMIHIYSDHGD